MKAPCEVFIKISIIFEAFFREIEAFSKIARFFKYIFSGIEAFSGMSMWPFYKIYCRGGFLAPFRPWLERFKTHLK
jgi:hypothetical protein